MASGQRTSRREYTKAWLSLEDQVKLLEERGLAIADFSAAMEFLSHVNYYRFSGYCLSFEDARHKFKKDTTFAKVRGAYCFDSELRQLIGQALEVLELDIRTTVAFHFGKKYGPFGHTHAENFYKRWFHSDWCSKLHSEANRSKEKFIEHFKNTYAEFPNLPIWVITETMSFGALSMMCGSMHREDQRALASKYGIQSRDFVSWIHHLSYIRNLCAHHSRLWDRIWAIKPQLPGSQPWSLRFVKGNKRLHSTLLILRQLTKRCCGIGDFSDEWRINVESLLDSPPRVSDPNYVMALPGGWKEHSVWRA